MKKYIRLIILFVTIHAHGQFDIEKDVVYEGSKRIHIEGDQIERLFLEKHNDTIAQMLIVHPSFHESLLFEKIENTFGTFEILENSQIEWKAKFSDIKSNKILNKETILFVHFGRINTKIVFGPNKEILESKKVKFLDFYCFDTDGNDLFKRKGKRNKFRKYLNTIIDDIL